MNELPEIQYGEFEALVKDHAIKEIKRVSNDNNALELELDPLKKDAPSVKALQAKWANWHGPTPAGVPHLRLSSTYTEELAKQINQTQIDNGYGNNLIPIKETKSNSISDHLSWIIPLALMVILWVFFMRRMGGGGGSQIFNIGKSRATLFDKDTTVSTTFNDVAGLEEAKVEIKEIVDFLKHPKKYTDLGAKIPKGALLVGPPGTGKTLLAKAVAGEAKVPFFSLSGSDFVEMFVGVGASRVRDLFKQAKEKSPCIIFIDEIDAIGRARGRSASQGSNDERENTLNQLLTEMDGFGTNSGVIILAATNRADILDRALLRAGRFDRQIYVDLPDLNERRAIFQVHLKPLKLEKAVDLDFLAKQTPGFSGADIANICNEAALIAARHDKKFVERQDFLDAVDRIIGGLEKKNKIISKDEKKVIAFHEAGHATVSWMLEHAAPLVKVTIVPRGRSLGAAWYLPDERQLTTTEQFMDEICATLGGRAAEEVVFGRISTGALSDLERITKQAYAMVTYYGLNAKIGNISYYDTSGNEFMMTKPYSEKTAETIDEEVKKLIDLAYEQTKKILRDNRDKLDQLAAKLIEKEVIFKEDLEAIFGKRQWDKDLAAELGANENGDPLIKPMTPEVKPLLPENGQVTENKNEDIKKE
ncbi:MAG: ATP-dependent zinc metalloprotease FtsH [Bacteroidota bacterium]|nr:ATP-dependent zinc metalloprotease FtsH [Bacteroidota bacterium]